MSMYSKSERSPGGMGPCDMSRKARLLVLSTFAVNSMFCTDRVRLWKRACGLAGTLGCVVPK